MQSINRLIDKSRNSFPAFTLIELMLVMAIMGLLGTISIGGFRAMRRGMEQSAVMRNVDQFVHNAYQRAVIDRQPTAVYFWNETREDEKTGEKLVVVGHAVAVRRSGRVSYKSSSHVIDEFGDLRYYVSSDEDGEEETGSSGSEKSGMRIYKMNDSSLKYALVRAHAENVSKDVGNITVMMTYPDWQPQSVQVYGYEITGGNAGEWEAGDAYGFEFAEITLPNNYIFGSSFSTDVSNPIEELSGTVIKCSPGSASGSVTIYQIRPGDDGKPTAKQVDTTQSADKDPSQRKY